MEQIPTESKSKIPKDHGYPLSSKILSEAFTGVPQYDLLKAIYKYKDEFWASSYQRKLKQQGIGCKKQVARQTIKHVKSLYTLTYTKRVCALNQQSANKAR